MGITTHALKRAIERTSLHPEDILLLIQEDVCVGLGETNEYSYWLFFSFGDGCKIAITSSDKIALISVWGDDFSLPEHVRAPTKRDKEDAKRLFLRWLNANHGTSAKEKKDDLNDPTLPCVISLWVYVEQYRHATFERRALLGEVWCKKDAFAFLHGDLVTIYDAFCKYYIEANYPIPAGAHVNVEIRIDGKDLRRYRFLLHDLKRAHESMNT